MKVKEQGTFITTPKDIERKWYVVDAQGKTLGRLVAQIIPILRGKHKPYFTPNLDCGDFVIVINAEKIHVTGKRLDDKMYYRYSGYPGGIYGTKLRDLLAKHPTRVIEIAARGMLPKGALGHQLFNKLKVYAGSEHPHAAQKPEVLEVE
jgi:large subunit ribosomal protein L13